MPNVKASLTITTSSLMRAGGGEESLRKASSPNCLAAFEASGPLPNSWVAFARRHDALPLGGISKASYLRFSRHELGYTAMSAALLQIFNLKRA